MRTEQINSQHDALVISEW